MDAIAWCEERLWVPHNPLSASLLFVATEHQKPILALRAVHSELAQMTALSHEPGLAQAKLNWWREAFLRQHTHPALEALDQLGLRERIDVTRLLALCDAVEASLDLSRSATIEQAWAHCQSLGGEALELEVAMLSQHTPTQGVAAAVRDLGAAGYWLRQVRDLSADARQGRWFVPLELQAEHQISRQEVIEGPAEGEWARLIEALVAVASQRLMAAQKALSGQIAPALVHGLIMSALDQRLAKHLTQAPARVLTERVLPGHLGNVWTAWRQARQCRAKAG